MRRQPEHFNDQELALLYVAKKLNEALRLEKLLDDSGLDYLVEPDQYLGGVVFRSQRVGAFFYVAPGDEGAAQDALRRNGFRPYTSD